MINRKGEIERAKETVEFVVSFMGEKRRAKAEARVRELNEREYIVRGLHGQVNDERFSMEERLYWAGLILFDQTYVEGASDSLPQIGGEFSLSDCLYIDQIRETMAVEDKCQYLLDMWRACGEMPKSPVAHIADLAIGDLERYILIREGAEACGVKWTITDEDKAVMDQFQEWLKDYAWVLMPAIWGRYGLYKDMDASLLLDYMPWAWNLHVTNISTLADSSLKFLSGITQAAFVLRVYPKFAEFLEFME